MQATPKGRLFALTRDELVECSALLACVRQGDLDKLSIPEKPLDILAQQIVASVAPEEWQADDLYSLFCGAYPFRNLERPEFDQVVSMLAEGYATRNGRAGARIFYDAIGQRIKDGAEQASRPRRQGVRYPIRRTIRSYWSRKARW